MKVIYEGTTVLGINGTPLPGQDFIEIAVQELVWGMVNEYYTVVNGHLVPLSQEEKDALDGGNELAQAKIRKEAEIKQAYIDAEESSTIEAGGNTYHSDLEHLSRIDLERRLADANGETEMIVFDVYFDPHTVSFVAVDNVMQEIRILSKANYTKAKGLIKDIHQATTVAQVEAIAW